MALFEGFERRIKQVNSVLKKYNIGSLEDAKKICDDKGIDVYNIVKSIQPICFENACFPAINLKLSGTRKEELLYSKNELKNVIILRKFINDMSPKEALEFILSLMRKFKSNEEIMASIENQKVI